MIWIAAILIIMFGAALGVSIAALSCMVDHDGEIEL